jgi:16S rRNA (cytosine967-C5)-methyltransferase
LISARRAAYNALTAIMQQGAYTALAMKKHIPSDMEQADRRFASLLLRTTLENLLRIDFALDHMIQTSRVHGSVKNVLRLGACQILFLDTEGYAAVSESVKLIKKIKPQMSGFVNGVLRNLARDMKSIPYPTGDTAEALSITYSYPLWICEKYIADFGFELTKALFAYTPTDGTVVRLNTLKASPEELETQFEKQGFDYTPARLPNTYIVKNMTHIESLDIFNDGWIAIQSESAMSAVRSVPFESGQKLLDACAAPGGKSAYAAALMDNTLSIVAWDVHPHRVALMEKNFARLGVLNVRTALQDARKYESCLASAFDVVMIDAPCSAMGLMARNPDIRYVRKPEDISSLCRTQKEILEVCANYVRQGGTLAYFTCSINREENEEITDTFLQENRAFDYITPPKTMYPHIDGSDGFYIAVMKRKK